MKNYVLLCGTILCHFILFNNIALATENIGILENPSPQDVVVAGNYYIHTATLDKPVFDKIVIFAANINGTTPDTPVLYYNPYLTTLLDESHLQLLHNLQQKGIKVELSYLGNHQNAGWSCRMQDSTIENLANAMVNDVVKYGLDGINVDDEYSYCNGDVPSFYNILAAIKQNPKFAGKTLTKDLIFWADAQYFVEPYNIAHVLDQGYSMQYGATNVQQLLDPYVQLGMLPSALYFGVVATDNTDDVYSKTSQVVADNYAGVMIFAITSDPNVDTLLYKAIAQAEYGTSATIISQVVK